MFQTIDLGDMHSVHIVEENPGIDGAGAVF